MVNNNDRIIEGNQNNKQGPRCHLDLPEEHADCVYSIVTVNILIKVLLVSQAYLHFYYQLCFHVIYTEVSDDYYNT